ncbi:putative E3 ubiquitin-protein ligase RF298 [Diospyros lotus]|uniref:putative E3 ubiquitin-protein ligase RF298 n=1 Tax=Diospyros lotus TaxID=55363 RepID=UPI00225B91FE|nr:putative E3 ubiquitin-protein ligase RF298 [Diospyros lotus]XP_052190642.1 putative E3 ubiquitin-protein ligase RF298 [Diospyros lotus]XP_052190644.1 putative E3 ubiquitin-protein ligase RF298 [Diospyros lotus]
MASMVAKASSTASQVLPVMPVQEKGSRNKRKFRADPPLGDPNKTLSLTQSECASYEFSAEKFEATPIHGHPSGCEMCSVSQDHSDALKLDLGLSPALGSSEMCPSRSEEETEAADGFHDADWSDLTESQLEELVLSNLDTIFKSAIRKIVACGFSEEVATKAVLRSGLCYGCKDTVSNIVDNTLAFLRSGQEFDPSREHCFEDLQQMEKYILAELVCVLQEVRPFFSTGDAMWCLLICDMNVSHACAMDCESLSGLAGDGVPSWNNSVPTQSQSRTETKNSELSLPSPCKPSPSVACAHTCQCETAAMPSIPFVHSSQSETPTVPVFPNLIKQKNSFVLNGLVPEKLTSIPASDGVDKSFGAVGTMQSHAPEEKFAGSRKISGISKREYILRQKSLHLEKSYRTYGSKGSSRAGKVSSLGGLILDKKLKSLSDSPGINVKSASLKLRQTMGIDVPQDNVNHTSSTNVVGLSSPEVLNLETVNTLSTLPKTSVPSTIPTASTPTSLSAADTELSLSLATKGNSDSSSISSNVETPNCSYARVPYDKLLGQCFPQVKKDEMMLKLVSRVRELQNQLQEWTEWANQKVMQAARRLSKDKAELKTLRQEKEEVERLKKEKQTLEENTMKKLSEMENALCKASGQVEGANAAVRRLEVENAALRQEMEGAKLQAAQSAASCQEVLMREKKTLMKFQSWQKQKTLFQEELAAEKRKLSQLQQQLEHAKDLHDQLEARWKQEEKAKGELLTQASSVRKEKEQIEASAKSKGDAIKSKAEANLQKCKDDIKKLEKEISQLRSQTDSSKIAALRRGIDGSYASRLTYIRNSPSPKDPPVPYIPGIVAKVQEYSGTGGVKRERECVMCLSEEMSVVFLPCAHQVVCTMCNELHEKQGMKDCPSCRSPIQRRIPVRYARS